MCEEREGGERVRGGVYIVVVARYGGKAGVGEIICVGKERGKGAHVW
jgi:hypothetical protein